MRSISSDDHLLLVSLAWDLSVLSRVGVYPEDEFEARLVHGEVARATVLREDTQDYATRLMSPTSLRVRPERVEALSARRTCMTDAASSAFSTPVTSSGSGYVTATTMSGSFTEAMTNWTTWHWSVPTIMPQCTGMMPPSTTKA